ncbi:hypothetical protein FB451DRAFT_1237158 [Mycena latifolia]|nr:hypothetical protein FB451DRAFT_1237158 [Mycena latifolia]
MSRIAHGLLRSRHSAPCKAVGMHLNTTYDEPLASALHVQHGVQVRLEPEWREDSVVPLILDLAILPSSPLFCRSGSSCTSTTTPCCILRILYSYASFTKSLSVVNAPANDADHPNRPADYLNSMIASVSQALISQWMNLFYVRVGVEVGCDALNVPSPLSRLASVFLDQLADERQRLHERKRRSQERVLEFIVLPMEPRVLFR